MRYDCGFFGQSEFKSERERNSMPPPARRHELVGGQRRERCFPLATTTAEFQNILLLREETRRAAGTTWHAYRECLLNKRDCPILTREAPVPCVPVLSQYSGTLYKDVHMPAVADYKLTEADRPPSAPPPWHNRRSAAVFRGGATGGGVDAGTNARLRLCALSLQWCARSETTGLLDARLTSWNARHKLGVDGVVRIIDAAVAAPPLRERHVGRHNQLCMDQQAHWKFYVLIDGNVGASRLGELSAYRFLILWVRSHLPQVEHASLLQPWEHYIPVEMDLSDLESRIRWCRANDDRAEAIATACHDILAHRLTKSAIEGAVAFKISGLPPPLARAAFEESMWWVWSECRACIYVLLDESGKLVFFRPFADANHTNRWSGDVRFEPNNLKSFLRKAAFLERGRVVMPDPRRWWKNGALVCNIMPPGVWGESMMSELHQIISAAAKQCAAATTQQRGSWQQPLPASEEDAGPSGRVVSSSRRRRRRREPERDAKLSAAVPQADKTDGTRPTSKEEPLFALAE